NNDFRQKEEDVICLPASRFLRPYTSKEKSVQEIKVNRIKSEMSYAAQNGRNYHLWWHPHNFGYCLKENMQMLTSILEYYKELHLKYNFASKSMIEMVGFDL